MGLAQFLRPWPLLNVEDTPKLFERRARGEVSYRTGVHPWRRDAPALPCVAEGAIGGENQPTLRMWERHQRQQWSIILVTRGIRAEIGAARLAS